MVVLASVAASAGFGASPAMPLSVLTDPREPAAALTPADEALLNDLESASFRYFVEQSHPVTGLVRDRARADGSPSAGKASIAACGFALSAWVVGTERGWIDRQTAIARCRQQLRFLATKAPRVHGFFYHFMEMDTGARAWKCEVSTIDTGLFLAGAITAREYFHDPEITALVNQLYREVDWPWFLDGGKTFVMCWDDEVGFSRYRWSRYSELMMLTLLGIGAPRQPIPAELWGGWQRGPTGDYAGFHYIQFPSLFVHQFTHAYIDFRGLRDAYADYYRNSVLATLAQRQFCADLSREFPTWGSRFWGLTASDSASGYKGGWGGPPRTVGDTALDGTLVPCGPAGSAPFTPRETMAVLQAMRRVYGRRIWKRYGFADAFNPETGWVNPDVIGIDVGIQLLQAENARTGLITSTFSHAPEVKRALARAGFLRSDQNLSPLDREVVRAAAENAWRDIENAPLRPETAGLQLSAYVAARSLGFLTADEATARAAAALNALPTPSDPTSVAEYAAGLITIRQAMPELSGPVSRRLATIDWPRFAPTSNQLGSIDRLLVFLQIASGARPASDWARLRRQPERVNSVFVLAPASVSDQLLPGLWLDERSIITGASAAQLAYARALSTGAPRTPRPNEALTMALLVEQFPSVAIAALRTHPGAPSVEWSPTSHQAAFLLAVANLLDPESIRSEFQKDPGVRRARAAIAEFRAADFGPTNSTFWRNELAGSPDAARHRPVYVDARPRGSWPWLNAATAHVGAEPTGAELRLALRPWHAETPTPAPKTYIIAAETAATRVKKPWRDRRVSAARPS